MSLLFLAKMKMKNKKPKKNQNRMKTTSMVLHPKRLLRRLNLNWKSLLISIKVLFCYDSFENTSLPNKKNGKIIKVNDTHTHKHIAQEVTKKEFKRDRQRQLQGDMATMMMMMKTTTTTTMIRLWRYAYWNFVCP